MVDFVDLQFATMLSGRLDRYKIKTTNPYKINFRCPICSDSQKNKFLARAWLLEDRSSNTMYFKCFNCNAPIGPLSNFLKTLDMSLYNEYVTEKYIGKNKEKPKAAIEQEKYKKPVFNSDPLKSIKKISQLKHDHPVKKYIEARQIPPAQHYKLYYAPKFIAWINSIIPGKLNDKMKDEPRLILPFKDEFGKVFGVSARGFDPNGMRYITIMFDETRSKIFGLDTVDFTKRYYIVEGALDSLFIENSVAMAGADGNATSFPNIENAVFVFDLEYRNREILSRISRLVEKGHSVCLWPSTLADRGKDINDLIISGLKSQEIEKIIIENTYKGLLATLKIAELRKV